MCVCVRRTKISRVQIVKKSESIESWESEDLEQWFLTFSKSGNTFDYMKNLRDTKINDPKNKQKHPT